MKRTTTKTKPVTPSPSVKKANALALAVAVKPQDNSIMAVIERAARDPKVDVTKMQALLDMKDRVMAEEAKRAYQVAMVAVQAEVMPVVRDAENKHTRSAYARLETIDAAVRPIYTKHGFALSYDSAPGANGGVTTICKVMHDAGHMEVHKLDGALDMTGAQGTANKTAVQGLGSTVSYMRRYLMCMIFNVVLTDEDNDGNKTGKPKPQDGDVFASKMKKESKITDVTDDSLEAAFNTLYEKIGNWSKKSMRSKWLNDNLATVRRLADADRQDLIDKLHALVDAGA